MSVDCGADILIHVPMKEEFPKDLAEKIAERNIAVVPTLVMMNTFANSGKNDYKPAVSYGTSMHHEMELLVQAGLTPLEVLKAPTA